MSVLRCPIYNNKLLITIISTVVLRPLPWKKTPLHVIYSGNIQNHLQQPYYGVKTRNRKFYFKIFEYFTNEVNCAYTK